MNNARYFDEGKLVVFERNRILQARIHLGGGYYKWKSLKTKDWVAAEKAAWKLYAALEDQIARGLPPKSKTLNEVITEYVAFREKDCERGKTSSHMLRQIRRVVKFWREYAGSKPIEGLGDTELAAYDEWRRDYYLKWDGPLPRNAKRDPADKTLQWEITLAKSIIKWADQQGWRGSIPLPGYSFVPKVKGVRPAFEKAEFDALRRTLEDRVKTCTHASWRASRALLLDYVMFLAYSGLRVGEANSLKVRDCQWFTDVKGRRNLRLVVKGKTGERDCVPRAKIADRIWRNRIKGRGPDELVFAMPDGGKISTLGDQFNAALNEAGLTHNSRGEKFTLYSLRHYYAVMSLRSDKSVFAVARNMGTSVEVIQQYYGKHATARTFADRLGD